MARVFEYGMIAALVTILSLFLVGSGLVISDFIHGRL